MLDQKYAKINFYFAIIFIEKNELFKTYVILFLEQNGASVPFLKVKIL
jgi:hypothetical protein